MAGNTLSSSPQPPFLSYSFFPLLTAAVFRMAAARAVRPQVATPFRSTYTSLKVGFCVSRDEKRGNGNEEKKRRKSLSSLSRLHARPLFRASERLSVIQSNPSLFVVARDERKEREMKRERRERPNVGNE